ncbi:Hypothetical predicted protein, partial [Podarcis lilfordi]
MFFSFTEAQAMHIKAPQMAFWKRLRGDWREKRSLEGAGWRAARSLRQRLRFWRRRERKEGSPCSPPACSASSCCRSSPRGELQGDPLPVE